MNDERRIATSVTLSREPDRPPMRTVSAPAAFRPYLIPNSKGSESSACRTSLRDTKPSRTESMAGPGRPGRSYKGDRSHLSAKVPTILIAAADAEAQRRGLDRTAIVVEALAARFGLPVPADIQEKLPLNPAA